MLKAKNVAILCATIPLLTAGIHATSLSKTAAPHSSYLASGPGPGSDDSPMLASGPGPGSDDSPMLASGPGPGSDDSPMLASGPGPGSDDSPKA